MADSLYFNVSHGGDYVVGVVASCEVGCDIEKIEKASLEIAQHYFTPAECSYIKSASDKDKAFLPFGH